MNSNTSERNLLGNKIVLRVTIIISLALGLGYVAEIIKGSRTLGYFALLSSIIIGTLLLDIISYIRAKDAYINRYFFLFGYLLVYGFALLTKGSPLTFVFFIPALSAYILYFDLKYVAIACGSMAVVNVMQITQAALSGAITKADTTNYTIIIAAIGIISYALIETTIVNNKGINNNAMEDLEGQQRSQMNMVENILDIAKAVQDKVEQVDSIMNELTENNNMVSTAVNEIAEGTLSNAESISKQADMTTAIQEVIDDVSNNSNNMVAIASESAEVVQSGNDDVKNLMEQAVQVKQINKDVVEAMTNLREKTSDVRDIASIIFSISSQTNLLALNASIESARAGEAGKGFAVVADQIRNLAEETRKSTEDIGRILDELCSNADETAVAVKNIEVVTDKQSELINQTGQHFEEVMDKLGTLTDDINDVDGMIQNIVESNGVIVDSVERISSVTEEVTANSREAANMCDNTVDKSDKVKELLDELVEQVERFDQYL